MELANNIILITGGASGIGRGLAERFIQEGNVVIVCGRREDVLQEMKAAFPSIITRACDLARADERIALYQWIATEHSTLNVLVNNAGMQNWMAVTDADFFTRAEQEIAINIEAPVHLCALFSDLPSLRTIINVTSALAFVPYAKIPVYSATKAFFHSFTHSLRYLLASRGVEVIELIPPALNTDLGGKGLHDAAPPVSTFIDAVFTQLALGSTEVTHGFGEAITKAGPEELKAAFARLNPAG